jgi:hypothetical protein
MSPRILSSACGRPFIAAGAVQPHVRGLVSVADEALLEHRLLELYTAADRST